MAEFLESERTLSQLPGYVVDASSMKVPAGWLIDQAGLERSTTWTWGVHDRQALVIVNHGEQHRQKYGIWLPRRRTFRRDTISCSSRRSIFSDLHTHDTSSFTHPFHPKKLLLWFIITLPCPCVGPLLFP
ncbi:MAG: hypothetical protein IPJ06_20000 [Saprospiraceae bacterium]|nr:hypothetical protein [Saprospiraceae bacterium]